MGQSTKVGEIPLDQLDLMFHAHVNFDCGSGGGGEKFEGNPRGYPWGILPGNPPQPWKQATVTQRKSGRLNIQTATPMSPFSHELFPMLVSTL